MNSLNGDMNDGWLSRNHPEDLRWRRVIAPECYLADEPQAYLVILLEAVRPNRSICHGCKARCLEALVKGTSSDNVYWNTKPHVIYPGEPLPTSKRLEARLDMMGINKTNNYGLDLSDDDIMRFFEPAARRLVLYASLTEPLATAANDLCEFSQIGREDPWLGDKLEFMILSSFIIDDLVFGRDPCELILLVGRILSRYHEATSAASCECAIYTDALYERTPDDISPLEWPQVVLSFARGFFEIDLINAWTSSSSSGVTNNPLHAYYAVPQTQWVSDWQSKFDRVNAEIARPSRSDLPELENCSDPNYSRVAARDDALRLFLIGEFDRSWQSFQGTEQFQHLIGEVGPKRLEQMDWSIAEEEAQAEAEFVRAGGSVLYTGLGQLPTFAIEWERKETLRHGKNSANRRFWECEGDEADPMEDPSQWARLT